MCGGTMMLNKKRKRLNLSSKNRPRNLTEEVLVALLNFGWGLNCNILSDVFIYVPKNISKRDIKKINFYELPKKNSRIKITKIKIWDLRQKL